MSPHELKLTERGIGIVVCWSPIDASKIAANRWRFVRASILEVSPEEFHLDQQAVELNVAESGAMADSDLWVPGSSLEFRQTANG